MNSLVMIIRWKEIINPDLSVLCIECTAYNKLNNGDIWTRRTFWIFIYIDQC